MLAMQNTLPVPMVVYAQNLNFVILFNNLKRARSLHVWDKMSGKAATNAEPKCYDEG